VHGSTVLYPCDPNQTAQLLKLIVELPGISYLRTTREKTPVVYGADELFPIGGSKVVKQSPADRATIIAAGITLHEALKAYDKLKAAGTVVRVIDLYSVKPIDQATLRQAAQQTGGRLVVVEDHWPEGGLGDAVLQAFSGSRIDGLTLTSLAVRHMPGSATPAESLHAAAIDADAIQRAVTALL
jgi:transketolase